MPIPLTPLDPSYQITIEISVNDLHLILVGLDDFLVSNERHQHEDEHVVAATALRSRLADFYRTLGHFDQQKTSPTDTT
jgi:hypothetical protein